MIAKYFIRKPRVIILGFLLFFSAPIYSDNGFFLSSYLRKAFITDATFINSSFNRISETKFYGFGSLDYMNILNLTTDSTEVDINRVTSMLYAGFKPKHCLNFGFGYNYDIVENYVEYGENAGVINFDNSIESSSYLINAKFEKSKFELYSALLATKYELDNSGYFFGYNINAGMWLRDNLFINLAHKKSDIFAYNFEFSQNNRNVNMDGVLYSKSLSINNTIFFDDLQLDASADIYWYDIENINNKDFDFKINSKPSDTLFNNLFSGYAFTPGPYKILFGLERYVRMIDANISLGFEKGKKVFNFTGYSDNLIFLSVSPIMSNYYKTYSGLDFNRFSLGTSIETYIIYSNRGYAEFFPFHAFEFIEANRYRLDNAYIKMHSAGILTSFKAYENNLFNIDINSDLYSINATGEVKSSKRVWAVYPLFAYYTKNDNQLLDYQKYVFYPKIITSVNIGKGSLTLEASQFIPFDNASLRKSNEKKKSLPKKPTEETIKEPIESKPTPISKKSDKRESVWGGLSLRLSFEVGLY